MIKVENLTKKYGSVTALNGVSFVLNEGEVVGILGPNGAGKTTLLRILVMFLSQDDGTVTIEGMDIRNPSFEQAIKNKIGYLPEHAPLYEDMTVEEYLMFVGRMYGIAENDLCEKLSKVVERCGLKEKVGSEISTLSKGYRQRTGIAQALIHDPKIIILDEPTTGLDPNQRIEIRDLIKEIGKSKTVILSSHVLSEVQATCSRILIINKGKIVADGTSKDLERMGQGKPTIYAQVEKITESLVEKLKALGGIMGVDVSGNNLHITVDIDVDLRKDIAKILVEEESGLLELSKKQFDLEDLFISLTKGNE